MVRNGGGVVAGDAGRSRRARRRVSRIESGRMRPNFRGSHSEMPQESPAPCASSMSHVCSQTLRAARRSGVEGRIREESW